MFQTKEITETASNTKNEGISSSNAESNAVKTSEILNLDFDLEEDDEAAEGKHEDVESSLEFNNKNVKNQLSRKVKDSNSSNKQIDAVKQEALEEVK